MVRMQLKTSCVCFCLTAVFYVEMLLVFSIMMDDKKFFFPHLCNLIFFTHVHNLTTYILTKKKKKKKG